MKKIILFGAGENGKRALEFLGNDNVECFVDNAKEKIGKIYCGKPIISIEQLKTIYMEYEIMVTVNRFGEIAEQLKGAGIKGYTRFLVPNIKKVLEYLFDIDFDSVNNIVLWGTDMYAKAIYNSLNIDIKNKIKCCVSTSEMNLFADNMQLRVIDMGDDIGSTDVILIASPKCHLATELKIKRLYNNVKIWNPYRMDKYYSPKELVINKYSVEGNEIKDEEALNEKNKNRIDYFEAVKEYVDEALQSPPLFHLVEIETINRCNGNCSFCPVNHKDDPREHTFMDENLFYSIINQLEELSYDERISLFSNNEPFLDNRIIEFSEYARKHLPKAKIHMFTNGTLLTLDKFIEIIPFLDELIIDNYTEDLSLIKPVSIIKDYCESHPDLIQKVSIVLRKPNELLTTRGGDAPNRQAIQTYPDITCAFPFQQLIIRPTGKISLCCNDAVGKYTLGDLTKERIIDVWYGETYNKIRELMSQGRGKVGNCQCCDTFSLYL